ncbi:MAG: hypothetical protein ABL973_11215 [Micropepsaceae bacterium]
MVTGTEDQALVLFKEFADWSLRGLHFGVTQDVTKWLSGLALCGHTANRLQSAIRDRKPIKWAKNKGMTFGMFVRFNLVAVLFFVMLAAGGALNVIADIQSLQDVYHRYSIVPSLTAITCLVLIFYNYAQLVVRGYKQHKLDRVWDRLAFAHRTTESRGIKLVELVSIPVALIVPIPMAIDWLRVYIDTL